MRMFDLLLSIKHLTILKTVWYPKLIFIYFDSCRIKTYGKKSTAGSLPNLWQI